MDDLDRARARPQYLMSVTQGDVSQRPSRDAQVMMMFDARKKNVIVAYLLWLFLGVVGAHRFYLGKTSSAVAMLLLFVGGWLLLVVVVGAFLLMASGIWTLVDAFLIPGLISQYNSRLAAELGGDPAWPPTTGESASRPSPYLNARHPERALSAQIAARPRTLQLERNVPIPIVIVIFVLIAFGALALLVPSLRF